MCKQQRRRNTVYARHAHHASLETEEEEVGNNR
jgi:hypothetical protein